MAVLSSQVDASDAFEERRAQMEALVAELRERSAPWPEAAARRPSRSTARAGS